MAFCYPGRSSGGDAPPSARCAGIWRDRIMRRLGHVRLTLLIGSYAQEHVLGRGAVAKRVRDFRGFGPDVFPLPHPSWRSRGWMQRNPWFEDEVLPELRLLVREALSATNAGSPPKDGARSTSSGDR
jgi:uracil-DNA glycosylase